MKDKIIIALDVSSQEDAMRLVRATQDLCGMFKVGSQLYMAAGPSIIQEIIDAGGSVFLDLKFHDIPNTVVRAAVEAAKRGVSMLTIHACGGRAMMTAVAGELSALPVRPLVMAVTVLTSLNAPALAEIGVGGSLDQHVRRLAVLAQDCGAHGVVCSPQEIQVLRGLVKSNFKLVVPGIRMPGQSAHDQSRIASPQEALSSGADFLVVGRAITKASDPRSTLKTLLETCSGGL